MELEEIHDHMLKAVGGSERVEVMRSVFLDETDPWMDPVREYIADHGLVLAARQEFEDDDWMMRRVEMSVYVPPAVRDGVLAGTELSLPWIGVPLGDDNPGHDNP